MMLLRVTPPNGGSRLEFWAPLSFKLDEVEKYSWAGGTVEILDVKR